MSRWENAPTLREAMRMTYTMIDSYCASYVRPPHAVTLDIDDTVDCRAWTSATRAVQCAL
jgi:hypothetical protein